MGQQISSPDATINLNINISNPNKTPEDNYATFKQTYIDKLNLLKEEDINLIREMFSKKQLTQRDIEKLKSIEDPDKVFTDIIKNIEEATIKIDTNPDEISEIKSDIKQEGQEKFHQWVSKMIPIKSLCPKHMIDPLYEHFVSILNPEEKIFREKMKKAKIKFFKENLIISLKKNENIINVYLSPLISESYTGIDSKLSEAKDVFFKLQFLKDNQYLKYLNFVGFTKKIYYYKTASPFSEKNPKLKNKKSLLIFNSDQKLLSKQIYLGIKIYENGKLFAGRFNDQCKLDGRGIYIDKKGNVFLSDFTNSEMESALIYGADNTIYKGLVMNYRKQGISQSENSESYEFIGDYKRGKKIKGIYFPKSSRALITKNKSLLAESYVKSIEIDEENFISLKKTVLAAKIDYYAKYLIKSYYNDVLLAYYGRVVNGKLNDKCIIYFDNKKKFPCFEGEFVDNKRKYGKYSWNDKEYYLGKFKDNLFHNKADTFWSPDEADKSIVRAFGRDFNILCEKGRATRLKNIKRMSIIS